MDNNFSSQHNFTSALVKIRLVVNTMESGLEEMLDHIEHETGNNLINKGKMGILRNSVKSLLEYTETLEHISKFVTFPQKDEAS